VVVLASSYTEGGGIEGYLRVHRGIDLDAALSAQERVELLGLRALLDSYLVRLPLNAPCFLGSLSSAPPCSLPPPVHVPGMQARLLTYQCLHTELPPPPSLLPVGPCGSSHGVPPVQSAAPGGGTVAGQQQPQGGELGPLRGVPGPGRCPASRCGTRQRLRRLRWSGRIDMRAPEDEGPSDQLPVQVSHEAARCKEPHTHLGAGARPFIVPMWQAQVRE